MTTDGWLYSAGEYPPGIKPFSRQAPWMDVDPPVRDYCGPACRALADQATAEWRRIANALADGEAAQRDALERLERDHSDALRTIQQLERDLARYRGTT